MRLPEMTPVSGIILSIAPFARECCSHLVSVRTPDGIINFVVSQETFIVDSLRLRPGMRVTVFYNPDLPVPLIFPPQYRAEVVVPTLPEDQIALTYFDRNLNAENGSLKLNPDRRTTILTTNGQSYECSPGGNTLLVYYRVTTRSIPPQTTPRKIIVFCG